MWDLTRAVTWPANSGGFPTFVSEFRVRQLAAFARRLFFPSSPAACWKARRLGVVIIGTYTEPSSSLCYQPVGFQRSNLWVSLARRTIGWTYLDESQRLGRTHFSEGGKRVFMCDTRRGHQFVCVRRTCRESWLLYSSTEANIRNTATMIHCRRV